MIDFLMKLRQTNHTTYTFFRVPKTDYVRLGILMTSRSLHSTSPQAIAVEGDERDDDDDDDDDRLAAIMSTIKVVSNQSDGHTG